MLAKALRDASIKIWKRMKLLQCKILFVLCSKLLLQLVESMWRFQKPESQTCNRSCRRFYSHNAKDVRELSCLSSCDRRIPFFRIIPYQGHDIGEGVSTPRKPPLRFFGGEIHGVK